MTVEQLNEGLDLQKEIETQERILNDIEERLKQVVSGDNYNQLIKLDVYNQAGGYSSIYTTRKNMIVFLQLESNEFKQSIKELKAKLAAI